MNEHTELGIFEAGISEMGEMEALRPIIQPTIGILTNIGGAHQENFSSSTRQVYGETAVVQGLRRDCVQR